VNFFRGKNWADRGGGPAHFLPKGRGGKPGLGICKGFLGAKRKFASVLSVKKWETRLPPNISYPKKKNYKPVFFQGPAWAGYFVLFRAVGG